MSNIDLVTEEDLISLGQYFGKLEIQVHKSVPICICYSAAIIKLMGIAREKYMEMCEKAFENTKVDTE